jgi:saccharopine dehydrogenase (NAD+, L-lysine forming)
MVNIPQNLSKVAFPLKNMDFCKSQMIKLGLIREDKIPADSRVALTPAQCKWIMKQMPGITIVAQDSPVRCYSNNEYIRSGTAVVENLDDCDIILGIKEIPPVNILPGKTYVFFSHTRKKQPYNQLLLQTIIEKKCTLIDYECLEHEDGQRIIGFGFFAGIVGAHNGIMAYGNRTGSFHLGRVYQQKDFKELIHSYFGVKIPNIKIAVTGSGRVSHGVVEVMNLMGIIEVEKDEYLAREFSYPVYLQLKGADLYAHKETGSYNRNLFHEKPQEFLSLFKNYLSQTDVLMNGVYWDLNVPRLFEREDVADPGFRISVISDITDDENGSVPINMGDQTIEDPVYGVDKNSLRKTAPYQPGSVDIIAVGNLPNELPRDASKYFGEQLIKYILADLAGEGSPVIERATIVRNGALTSRFEYLSDYAAGK